MHTVISQIVKLLQEGKNLSDKQLKALIRDYNDGLKDNNNHLAKKKLLPYYLKEKSENSNIWKKWNIDESTEKKLIYLLQMKPRRTASGVTTITVITKPWPCSSNCVYCPNDIRMPKSYLHNEPACQRAERNYFDPYLQVISRLNALIDMGHPTDKIEIIILGGTWNDYPKGYRFWFVTQIFKALNDGSNAQDTTKSIRKYYSEKGISNNNICIENIVKPIQTQIDNLCISYNEAYKQIYENHNAYQDVADNQNADFAALLKQQIANETSKHRVVGLVIETRPDSINIESASEMRKLGCTKIQMGIQSLDEDILIKNNRNTSLRIIQNAFETLRMFGFKIHVHYMINLFGSNTDIDKKCFKELVCNENYIPDEIKIYPCSLILGTKLEQLYKDGLWTPYSESELVDILVDNMANTKPYIRISRMIRDISSTDILAGNKKTNLRQIVEDEAFKQNIQVQEMRYREIASQKLNTNNLSMNVITYKTTCSTEHFIEWVNKDNVLFGFLRLSLPDQNNKMFSSKSFPINKNEAMIREVHVYGLSTEINQKANSVQHTGLGKKLISKAFEIAKDTGYKKINVISSIGTRKYYEKLGFKQNGLYQQVELFDAD